MQADRPQPPTEKEPVPLKIPLPDTAGLNPRQAAEALAKTCFDPYYRRYYDVTSVGETVPLPTNGWVAIHHSGGWSRDTTTVWWLKDGKAVCWVQTDPVTFSAFTVASDELAARIATLHELDRIRTIPKEPFAPVDPHSRDGGDDVVFDDITVKTLSAAPLTTAFSSVVPSLWRQIGSTYDRDLAAYLASIRIRTFPQGTTTGTHTLAELAPVWLDPAQVTTVPWPLTLALIHTIGENRLITFEPNVRALLKSLPKPGGDEQAWEKSQRRLRSSTPMNRKEQNKLECDLLDIETRLAASHVHALRMELEKAIHRLEHPVLIDE
ncbi:MAG: hypothetical protein QM755_06790 [Luteolibacter sp.]